MLNRRCHHALTHPHAGRLLPVATVNIFGLTRPVSVAWHVAGARTTVLVAEKSGVVKYMDSWVGQPTNTLLDISAQVDSHGDHGLTGAWGGAYAGWEALHGLTAWSVTRPP